MILVDPSGHDSCVQNPDSSSENLVCQHIASEILALSGGMFAVDFGGPKNWTSEELELMLEAVKRIMNGLAQQTDGSAISAQKLLVALFGGQAVSLRRSGDVDNKTEMGWSPNARAIFVYDLGISDATEMAWDLAHESGHIVQASFASTEEFLQATDGEFNEEQYEIMRMVGMDEADSLRRAYSPGNLFGLLDIQEDGWSYNAGRHPNEDWGDTFAYGTLCGKTNATACSADDGVYSVGPGTARLKYYATVLNRAKGS